MCAREEGYLTVGQGAEEGRRQGLVILRVAVEAVQPMEPMEPMEPTKPMEPGAACSGLCERKRAGLLGEHDRRDLPVQEGCA